MTNSSVLNLVRQMAFQLPAMIAFLVGIVLAFVYMRRARRACIFALAGFGIQLISGLVYPFIMFFALEKMRFGGSATGYGMIMTVVGVVFSVVHAVALGLIIAAVFSGRPKTSPVLTGVQSVS